MIVRVAITGAGGRLGRALTAALADAPFTGPRGPLTWSRPFYDLDDPAAAARCVERDTPDVVIHAAAWTDVDGCAREPQRAMRRNAFAVAELAEACAAAGTDLVLVSTNEVFDGRRTDGRPYVPGDRPAPGNPYGASKLAGENAAQAAFLRHHGAISPDQAARPDVPQLAIIRTAWLYGPPGNDFPSKILAAAERARGAAESLRVVGDEAGSPTYAPDLAEAIVDRIGTGSFAGVHHVVNGGVASRAAWARRILAAAGIAVEVTDVPLSSWSRASVPPAWAVLASSPADEAPPLRAWQAAFEDYLPILLRARNGAGAGGAR